MIHRRQYDRPVRPNSTIFTADLADPATLAAPCQGADCIVHFAGVLFRPHPEGFLPTTNTRYAENLIAQAKLAGVKRFILISFPHVEGPTDLSARATDRIDRAPLSVHAQTRLAEERALLDACRDGAMQPVILRVGMVYAKGLLMIDYAKKLMRRRILGVWRTPTLIHLISLRDFLLATECAIRKEGVSGIYNVGDDGPLTLQTFLDRAAYHWGLKPPWRAPSFLFFWAAWCVEWYARIMGSAAPLTRDFIRIGMVPYVMDTARMRRELLPTLAYPTLEEGIKEL
jgi:nucleoside-diphosphate-sugar epimerase